MEQPSQREQHLQADADSLRNIIAEERNRAQVVLSQKGVLEAVNAQLLEALEKSAAKLHDLRDEPECLRHVFRDCPKSYCVEARTVIEEARK
jgi:hypothetical protein